MSFKAFVSAFMEQFPHNLFLLKHHLVLALGALVFNFVCTPKCVFTFHAFTF
ncbi:hypothetical protein Hanom_Chr01g00067241 [Helianthus anomalus]